MDLGFGVPRPTLPRRTCLTVIAVFLGGVLGGFGAFFLLAPAAAPATSAGQGKWRREAAVLSVEKPPLRVYVAGFDIFRPDASAFFEHLKGLCQARGLECLIPNDSSPPGLTKQALAGWIFRRNTDMIRSADAVVADLRAFRGSEPDSGTSFEVGFAAALGKRLWTYTNETRTLVGQVAVRRLRQPDGTTTFVDRQGFAVEDFGLNANLMLACSSTVVLGDAEACLDAMVGGETAASMPSTRCE